ncbi:GVQW3 protein, partial [Acromyrmex heyeri]
MKGLTPKKIKAELDNVHSTSAAFATVYNWVNEFKRDRTSTCAPRSGRPIEAATPEIIDKVHDMVLTDRRVKVRELVEATGISHGTVISILHEQLGMKKIGKMSNILKKKRPLGSESIETEAYFEGLDKSYYSDGLKKLKNRWIKCIELKGDYIEKKMNKNESIKKNVLLCFSKNLLTCPHTCNLLLL